MDNKGRIIELIKADPFISQQEIALKINLSRSTVANLISSLIKEGRIKGKAYILSEPNRIICIGAANIDRKLYIKETMTEKTSNPVTSTHSVGGVARNIAENLGRLNMPTSLVTISGSDNDWEMINHITSPYVDMSLALQSKKWRTGSYTAIIDQQGEMLNAYADMEVYDYLTIDRLEALSNQLKQAECIVIDLNLPKECVSYLSHFSNLYNIPLVVVTVSTPKMNRMPENLESVQWLITNLDESLAYFKLEKDKCTIPKILEKWLEVGINNIVLTSGADKVYYRNKNNGKVFNVKESQIVKDVTGAGDSFAAAVIYGWVNGFNVDDAIKLGLINSKATIETNETVRKDLTSDSLVNSLKSCY